MSSKWSLRTTATTAAGGKRQTRAAIRSSNASEPPRKRRRTHSDDEDEDDPYANLARIERMKRKPRTYGKKNSRNVEPPNDSAATSPSADDHIEPRADAARRRDHTGTAGLPLTGSNRQEGVNGTELKGQTSTKKRSGLNLKKTTRKPRTRAPSPSIVEEEVATLEVADDAPSTLAKDLDSGGLPLALPQENVLQLPLPKTLSSEQATFLLAQKRAVLRKFGNPRFDFEMLNSEGEGDELPNRLSLQQLEDILSGSIERSEGNSCLLVGPTGSGKSKLVDQALNSFADEYRPIVIRLNGYVQHTDRLALREIARQVVEQTGSKKFQNVEDGEDDNPFDDDDTGILPPPPSHLPSLIAALPSLSRPVVVILDVFSIFTEQPRQALLYCLLDTVQSCRASNTGQNGLAVIGITTRLDVVNFLEKRVKSRFSHRIFRTGNVRQISDWFGVLRPCLQIQAGDGQPTAWTALWNQSVDVFLEDEMTKENVRHMFGISRDIRSLFRVMTRAILSLTVDSPFLDARKLDDGLTSQQGRGRRDALLKLNYPRLALLIATMHSRTAGQDVVCFEMLFELFTTQVRTSSAAPVMLGGGSIGMANVGRQVMMAAFEDLASMKVFIQASSATANSPKEFIKYRCTIDYEDIKSVINQVGQTSLKKWFSKAQ